MIKIRISYFHNIYIHAYNDQNLNKTLNMIIFCGIGRNLYDPTQSFQKYDLNRFGHATKLI